MVGNLSDSQGRLCLILPKSKVLRTDELIPQTKNDLELCVTILTIKSVPA